MVSEVVSIFIHEGFWIDFIALKNIVIELCYSLEYLVWQVKEPETDGKEGQLNQISDKVIVSRK